MILTTILKWENKAHFQEHDMHIASSYLHTQHCLIALHIIYLRILLFSAGEYVSLKI